MQHLQVSGAVRPLKWPLDVKWLMWINVKQMVDDGASAAVICEKAKQLFEELSPKAPSTSTILIVHLFFILYYIFPV
jgi:hypothetical protein